MLAARPTVISSIMGLFEPGFVERLHGQGTAWALADRRSRDRSIVS
jgi:hypothetical protein